MKASPNILGIFVPLEGKGLDAFLLRMPEVLGHSQRFGAVICDISCAHDLYPVPFT